MLGDQDGSNLVEFTLRLSIPQSMAYTCVCVYIYIYIDV